MYIYRELGTAKRDVAMEQKIAAWVEENRDALIEELKEFLRIPSLTGYEGEA